MPTGELPRSLSVMCDRALVGTVSPGTRVTAVGVYSIHLAKEQGKGGQEAVAIRQPFLRCAASPAATCCHLLNVSIWAHIRKISLSWAVSHCTLVRVCVWRREWAACATASRSLSSTHAAQGERARRVVGMRQEEDSSRQAPQFTLDEVEAFKAFARRPEVQQRVFDMIAPQIFGSEQIKKAIACLLFGGSRKVRGVSGIRATALYSIEHMLQLCGGVAAAVLHHWLHRSHRTCTLVCCSSLPH